MMSTEEVLRSSHVLCCNRTGASRDVVEATADETILGDRIAPAIATASLPASCLCEQASVLRFDLISLLSPVVAVLYSVLYCTYSVLSPVRPPSVVRRPPSVVRRPSSSLGGEGLS